MSRAFVCTVSLLVGGYTSVDVNAAEPLWWATRGVKTSAGASNKSVATSGQAKWFLRCALAELRLRIPPESYRLVQAEIIKKVNLAPPIAPEDLERERSVLLVGQLKAVAKPLYDQLRAINSSWLDGEMMNSATQVTEPGSSPPLLSPYPWSVGLTDDSNRAPATLGQLKAVFALRIENLPVPGGSAPAIDSDRDGLDDSYEISKFGSLGAQSGNGDADGDGIKNLYERQCSTDPLSDQSQVSGASTSLTYDSEGRLLTKTGPTTSSASYDAEGNILSKQAAP